VHLKRYSWDAKVYDRAYTRQCDSIAPEDIDPTMWTHINYAFALIDPSSFKIAKMNTYDDLLYPRVIDLKMRSPGLKVFIAVGGWDAGGKVFSDMVSNLVSTVPMHLFQ
jgi:chitinase